MMRVFSTPKGDVTIRQATETDANGLFHLRIEALSKHPIAFSADIDMAKAKGIEAWGTLTQDYARDQSGMMIIALRGTELIGMIGIVRGHWPKTHHSATLWGAYVKPDWRRFHIGEKLVNNSIDWARENGITIVNLEVNVSNLPAIQCYSHCGFNKVGVEPKSIYYVGEYHDVLLMSKDVPQNE